jgi:hypothetical protein
VARYRDDIKAGDKVYLWESGKDGGIVGVSEVDKPPDLRPMPPAEEPFMLVRERFEGEQMRAVLRVTRRIDPPLSRSEILENPPLVNLAILRLAQGTNYRVTETEDQAIESLLKLRGGGRDRKNAAYSLEQCSLDTNIEPPRLASWIRALARKGQIIFYGPPGTGKMD